MFVFTQVFTFPQSSRYPVPSSVLKWKQSSSCICYFCCRPGKGFMNSKACIVFPAMLVVIIRGTNGSIARPFFSLWSLQVGREVLIMHTLEKSGRAERAAGLWATFDDSLCRNITAPCKAVDELCMGGTLAIAWLFPACWAQLEI